MNDCKIVSINELLEGNKRICLSSLRAFNKCELCPAFSGCESKVLNPELSRRMKELDDKKADLKRLKKEIHNLTSERGLR